MKRAFIVLLITVISLCASAPCCAVHRSDYKSLNLSDDDLLLISKAVCADAGNENYLIKACVTSMLLNRISDGFFPNDASSVIFENGALLFADKETVEKIQNDDALLEYTLLTKIIYEYGIDPSCGALFCFMDGDSDIEDFNVTIEIDGLVFAKP